MQLTKPTRRTRRLLASVALVSSVGAGTVACGTPPPSHSGMPAVEACTVRANVTLTTGNVAVTNVGMSFRTSPHVATATWQIMRGTTVVASGGIGTKPVYIPNTSDLDFQIGGDCAFVTHIPAQLPVPPPQVFPICGVDVKVHTTPGYGIINKVEMHSPDPQFYWFIHDGVQPVAGGHSGVFPLAIVNKPHTWIQAGNRVCAGKPELHAPV